MIKKSSVWLYSDTHERLKKLQKDLKKQLVRMVTIDEVLRSLLDTYIGTKPNQIVGEQLTCLQCNKPGHAFCNKD